MHYTIFASPVGELLLAGDKLGLRRLCFLADRAAPPETAQWQRDDEALAEAREEVLAYLAGRRRSFNVDVAPEGSDAQREVWAAVMRIPYGRTRTYGEVAQRLGSGKPVIAVSSASAANPLPILIPCHRLVAAKGIGRYSGGEALKQRLIAADDDDHGIHSGMRGKGGNAVRDHRATAQRGILFGHGGPRPGPCPGRDDDSILDEVGREGEIQKISTRGGGEYGPRFSTIHAPCPGAARRDQ